MKLLSINVSLPKDFAFEGKTVRTAIFKKPVSEAVRVSASGIEGDGQADRRVHGGADKAVYAYGANHFPYWSSLLGERSIGFGQFGENLTLSEVDESQWCLGDYVAIGDVTLMVSEPRIPCYKLSLAFDNKQMVPLFKAANRSGAYFRVVCEGLIERGMTAEWERNFSTRVSIQEIYHAILNRHQDSSKVILRKAQSLPILSDKLRSSIVLALS